MTPIREQIVIAVLTDLMERDYNGAYSKLMGITLTIQNHWEGWEDLLEQMSDWIVRILIEGK